MGRYSPDVEILPGVGVLGLRLGADRAAVESLLGKPSATHLGVAVYDDRDPALVLRYAEDGSLEMIEIPYSGCGNEVALGPVQLTYRLLDDVIEDLR